MTDSKRAGRPWLWGLTLGILVFISFYIGLAVWAYQRDVDLVYDNYYDKDIVFEQQIRRVERTDALPIKPLLHYDQQAESLTVFFSPAMQQPAPQGEILLFRPANLQHDRTFSLELLGDSLQTIQLPDLDLGLWRIKLSWASGGLEYYLEQPLMVQ